MFKALSRPLPDLQGLAFLRRSVGHRLGRVRSRGRERRTRSAAARSRSWRRSSRKVEEGARDKTIRGLVIISGKERGFIVGADIREFDRSRRPKRRSSRSCARSTRCSTASSACRCRSSAAINGFCVGGGLELALACHYRIATRDRRHHARLPRGEARHLPRLQRHGAVDPPGRRPCRHAGDADGIDVSASAARGDGLRRSSSSTAAARCTGRRARRCCASASRSRPASSSSSLSKWPARELLAKQACARRRARRRARITIPRRSGSSIFSSATAATTRRMKAAETRAFAPLMVSDQSRNLRRVFWLSELLKGAGAEEARLEAAAACTSSAPAPWAPTSPAGASPAAWR